jgi:Flp pilus assembly protein TadG
MKMQLINDTQRGVATVEFAITATVFFMMLVVIAIGGHIYWTNNALVEATRRGARYAANQLKPASQACTNASTTVDPVKNMVLYNTATPANGAPPLVPGLTASNVTVCYDTDFGVGTGTVSVKIENYTYNLVLPGVSRTITFPPFQTTIVGENAGYIPADK